MNLGTSGLRDSQASPYKDLGVFLTNCGQSFLLLWFRWLQTPISRTTERFLSGGFLMVQFVLINRMVINTNRHPNTHF